MSGCACIVSTVFSLYFKYLYPSDCDNSSKIVVKVCTTDTDKEVRVPHNSSEYLIVWRHFDPTGAGCLKSAVVCGLNSTNEPAKSELCKKETRF